MGLYSSDTSGDDGVSVCSGTVGDSMSQMYELSDTASDEPWNLVMEYATASLRAPSGYHDTDVAARFTVFGSL